MIAEHVAIAERGKLEALEGDLEAALASYQQAIRLVVADEQPEVFFRHYVDCAMEALEHLGRHDAVLAWCERALAHYRTNHPQNPLARRDRAHLALRQGVNALYAGQRELAQDSFECSARLAREAGSPSRLAELLCGWLRRGLHVERARLSAELNRHRYYVVRADLLRPDLARREPTPDSTSDSGDQQHVK